MGNEERNNHEFTFLMLTNEEGLFSIGIFIVRQGMRKSINYDIKHLLWVSMACCTELLVTLGSKKWKWLMKDTKSTSDTFLSYATSNISSPERGSIVVWKFDITENKNGRHSSFILFYCYVCKAFWMDYKCRDLPCWIFAWKRREKRKKIISYTAQWINNNSSSPAGRVSKKGRDIKNMKRQSVLQVYTSQVLLLYYNCCAKAGGSKGNAREGE